MMAQGSYVNMPGRRKPGYSSRTENNHLFSRKSVFLIPLFELFGKSNTTELETDWPALSQNNGLG